jgi:ABC-type arginine transport system permease subunit
MFDLAIQALACLGMFTLPFIFMGYVRSRVRHALRAVNKGA